MDEHPNEWWEVSTTKDACFRISEPEARRLLDVIVNGAGAHGALRLEDIYGDVVFIMLAHIDSVAECTLVARDSARLRSLLLKTEDEAFQAAHAKPEWET